MTHQGVSDGEAVMHASVELIEAMRGVGVGWLYRAPHRNRLDSEFATACTNDVTRPVVMGSHADLPTDFAHSREDRIPVDCPACLLLMREATDPVRYDFLRERGLVPELPLVSG